MRQTRSPSPIEIDGYDLDEASIAVAAQRPADVGLADRVRFQVRDAADPAIAGDYDLVLAIEMLHDVPDPVGILRTMKKLAGVHGAVLIADERGEDAFSAPASEAPMQLVVRHGSGAVMWRARHPTRLAQLVSAV